ncbi:hypothetical protein [Sulfurimonas sp. HSL-1716]|uniref:hypothetical protein n=1 Tax=Hydrocurvibacter sulfurireducens TaxID=3131937 RepID=UPI0031F8D751
MSLPDYQGIIVKAGADVASAVDVGDLLDLSAVKDKSRAVKRYNPINSDNQIVAAGALVQGAINMTVLYDPSASQGVNLLETAIDDNTEIIVIVEMKDSLGTNGTTITRTCRVTNFKVVGEQEGKYKAEVTIETVGTPAETAAA